MSIDKKKLTRQQQDKTKFTHDAYIFKSEGVRKGRRIGYWEKEGYARPEPDGEFFVYLHSTPIGGFDGRIRCRPFDSAPPPEATGEEPQRPVQQPDDSDGDEEI
jgi:hypothetical protein